MALNGLSLVNQGGHGPGEAAPGHRKDQVRPGRIAREQVRATGLPEGAGEATHDVGG